MRQFLFILTLIFLPLSMLGQETVHGVCGLYGDNVLWDLRRDTLFINGKGDMMNYEWGGRYDAPWKKYSDQIKCVIIEDSITSIGECAFVNCQHLTSVSLPQSLRVIGVRAFLECAALDSIVIPDNVSSIGYDAFYSCTSLRSVKLPEHLSALEGSVFYHCVSLDSICIPKGIKTLNGTFYGCTSLRYVEIPNSVTSIGVGVFKDCVSLRSIELPNSVTNMGKYVFQNCKALESITIPNSVTSMDREVFDGCTNLKTVKLSEQFTTIPAYTFKNCTSLSSIVIPDGVTSIEGAAFYGCENLSTIIIPKSVTDIGSQAFYNCWGIEDVFCYPTTMPQTAENAFDNYMYWPLQATLHVPKKLMGAYSVTKPWTVFERFMALPDAIDKEGENNSTIYYTFNDDETTVSVTSGPVKYAATVTVPNRIMAGGKYYGVTSVEEYAFMRCEDLTSVFLNNSISSVGRFAFADCSGLVTVKLPTSITAIEDYTFSNCRSLLEINIPDKVTSIGEGAFTDCRNLQAVSLSARTTYIGMRAFADCSALTTVELGEKLTVIDDNAFEECESLTSVTIPNSMTLIGSNAFKDCTALKEVVFDGCTGEISQNAFTGCTGLKDIYSYSDIPPAADEMAFDDNSYDADLHVPAASLEAYKSTAPWCYFKRIIPHEESTYGGIICQYEYNTTDMTATLVKVTVSNNTHEGKLVIPAELEADGKIYKVTSIAQNALLVVSENFKGFTSIEIPNTVRSIGPNTISITEPLKTIRIMGDMEEIREQAFKGGIYAVGGHLLICSLNDFYCYSSFVPKLSPLAFNGQV